MIMMQHFIDNFMALVPLQLPQLIDVTTMESPEFYGDYALLRFPLKEPCELEEVLDMLEDDIEMITLYHHIPSSSVDYGQSACAYSNPAFGQMFKVNVQTDGSGKVSLVAVTVYDSLELMCGDICLDLRFHSERGGYFKYKKEKEDVLIDFL